MITARRGLFWRFFHASRRMKIVTYFLLFTAQIVAYTAIFHYAYPILEKKSISWPTSLLFVLETVTTLGYGELLPFENEITILITIVMLITGVILIFMIIPLLLVPYLSSLFQWAPPRKPPHALMGHVIIVGYGELTQSLIECLSVAGLPLLIVVDEPETARRAAQEIGTGAYVIWGDYSEPSLWYDAGVRNAHTTIICEDERTSAAIILGIRASASGRIIAVVDKLSLDRYLRYAGADYVLSAKHVTGQILARHAALTTHIDTIIEETLMEQFPGELPPNAATKLRIINIPIVRGSRAAGKHLRDLDLPGTYGFSTLMISRGGHFRLYPTGDEILDASTMLFLIGQVDRIEHLVATEFMPRGDQKELAIIGGFGDVGLSAYHELTNLGIECIAIDQKKYDITQVMGNTEDEATLREAHIEEAKFFIIALNDDDLNIFTTLIARDLNPDMRILARANEPESVPKLYRAGADYVALLPSIGGQVIGGVVLSDIVYVILNLPNAQKVVRKKVQTSISRTIEWVERKTGVRIVGIEGTSRSVVSPGNDELLIEGDSLIAIGYAADLKKLIDIL
ncbi:MAG: potassium transporter TrkA [Methanomicrobiales archaeon]|nr:potassium transporter TrkA [Methanomicrobiales archaeon]